MSRTAERSEWGRGRTAGWWMRATARGRGWTGTCAGSGLVRFACVLDAREDTPPPCRCSPPALSPPPPCHSTLWWSRRGSSCAWWCGCLRGPPTCSGGASGSVQESRGSSSSAERSVSQCVFEQLLGKRLRESARLPWVRFPARWKRRRLYSPHRPREGGLAYPADTSRTNLAAALALRSRWRLSKPLLWTINPKQDCFFVFGSGCATLRPRGLWDSNALLPHPRCWKTLPKPQGEGGRWTVEGDGPLQGLRVEAQH
jgi:hypothetical protein